ncbi:MAG: PH domain-containing protein [Candidatus ainarchaeum sp.]|nr:PH domain-containing protein [Candidatus ainarchaeum sp.]
MQIIISVFIGGIKIDFLLQKGEKVISEFRPQKQMIYMNILKMVLLAVLLFLLFLPNMLSSKTPNSMYFTLWAIYVLVIAWGIIASVLKYRKEHYWVTDKRLVIKKGYLGYNVISIPYAKISDLTISRNFLEQIFKVGSIYIQTLAGQISSKNKKGAEGYLAAINNPEEIQELIFKQMKQ